MTKLITKKWVLLCALIAVSICCFQQNLSAQCAAGETGVDIIVDTTVGSFDNELGWALIDDQGAVVASLDCDEIVSSTENVILIESVCLTLNSTYTFLGFDDFGDGWNSNTVQIIGNENGTFGGCIYVPTFSPNSSLGAIPDLGADNDNCFADTSVDLEADVDFTAGVFPDNIAIVNASLTGGICNSTDSETLSISVTNGCGNDLLAGDAEVTVTITDPNGIVGPFIELLPAILGGETIDYDLTTLIDMSAFGVYSLDISVDFSAASGYVDTDNTDNSGVLPALTQDAITTPFQNFENFAAGAPPTDGIWTEGWITGPTTGYRWEAEASTGANANSSDTGPFFDHTDEGVAGGIYMYTEATNGSTGDVAVLISPCLDLGTYTCPKIEFWYHMFGGTMGDLHVDINDGSGWVEDIVAPLTGQQQTTGDGPWMKISGNIADYAGEVVQVRFRGVKGSNFTSDIAIDDFDIVDDLSNNIAITDVASSNAGCNPSDAETLSITVNNVSCNDLPGGSLDVSFEMIGGAGVIMETISDAIPANSSVTHTFATTIDISALGAHDFDFTADFNAGSGLTDADLEDNSTSLTVTTTALFSVINGDTPAYVESFEADNGEWIVSDEGINTSTIVLGTPSGLQTNIAAASDGTMAWFSDSSSTSIVNAGEFYNPNEKIFFQTGCFDMSCMATATFSIDVNFGTEAGFDGGSVGYSTDGGLTFTPLGSHLSDEAGLGINWYNEDVTGSHDIFGGINLPSWAGAGTGWQTATHSLDMLAGETSIIFAIAFTSDGSAQSGEGFAFDNVQVIGDTTDEGCTGCMDAGACNYDPTAIYDDTSCEFTSCAGCMDASACNYDATATIDDVSCEFTSCAGCTDMTACNYDETATIDDNSCSFGTCGDGNCDVACGEDISGCVDCLAVNFGCTNMTACNYDPTANVDDGSCVFGSCGNGVCEPICGETVNSCADCAIRLGCTDSDAHNYSPRATVEDGSCETCDDGIMNGDEVEVDCGGAKCLPCTMGCMDVDAHNYDDTAVVEDGNCETCADGIMNGDETGVDCGGSNPNCGVCGDLCINALDIACGDVVTGDTNNNTGNDVPANCGGVNNPDEGAWYTFTGTGEDVLLSTDNPGTAGFDTNLQVYEGSCGALTCVAGDEDGGSIYTSGWTSELTITSTPGTNYYVYVSGFDGSQGAYELSMTCYFPLAITVDGIISVPASGFGAGGSVNVSVTGGNTDCGPLTYDWVGPDVPDPNSLNPLNPDMIPYTASTEDLIGLTAVGEYTLIVTDCLGNEDIAIVDVPLQTRGRGTGRGRKAAVVATSQLTASPNPFANATMVSFEVNTEERVSLDVFDIRGAKVATLFDGTTEAGQNYQVQFGEAMPSGTYIAKLTTSNGQVQHIKLFLTK